MSDGVWEPSERWLAWPTCTHIGVHMQLLMSGLQYMANMQQDVNSLSAYSPLQLSVFYVQQVHLAADQGWSAEMIQPEKLLLLEASGARPSAHSQSSSRTWGKFKEASLLQQLFLMTLWNSIARFYTLTCLKTFVFSCVQRPSTYRLHKMYPAKQATVCHIIAPPASV